MLILLFSRGLFIVFLLLSVSWGAHCCDRSSTAQHQADLTRLLALQKVLLNHLWRQATAISRTLYQPLYPAINLHFSQEKQKLASHDYDTIIVGGGISGTAVAVAIGAAHKVLVLDKNRSYPSVFGNSGAFFLNTKYPSTLFETDFSISSMMSELSPLNTRRLDSCTKPHFGADDMVNAVDASVLGDVILIHLFYSGADVLMNSFVQEIRLKRDENKTLYQVITRDGATFTAPHVVIASGLGEVSLDKFDRDTRLLAESELNSQSEIILDAETFLRNCREQANYPRKFANKAVAVIGGQDGGSAVIMALLGCLPRTVNDFASLEEKISNLKNSRDRLAQSILWFGRGELAKMREESKPQAAVPFILEVFNTDKEKLVSNFAEKIASIKKSDSGQLEITTEQGAHFTVDHVILATGYAKYFENIIPDEKIREKLLTNLIGCFYENLAQSLIKHYPDLPTNKCELDIIMVGAAIQKI